MHDREYESLVSEFCAEIGIGDPQAVIRSQHLEAKGKVIGLIPCENDDGLSVYIDLGPLCPQDDPLMLQRLLVANLESRGDIAGAFCMHPGTGHATYHMPVQSPVSASQLVVRLGEALDRIGARFDELQTASA